MPAVTIGNSGEGGNWHSLNEWYRPVDAYVAPQRALLTILMLTGLDRVTKPALAGTAGGGGGAVGLRLAPWDFEIRCPLRVATPAAARTADKIAGIVPRAN